MTFEQRSEQEGSGHKDISGNKETIEEYVPDKENDFYFPAKRIYLSLGLSDRALTLNALCTRLNSNY